MSRVELYRFSESSFDAMGANQEGTVWTWTSGQEPIEYNGETYLPAAISRGQIEAKEEISKANIEVHLDLGNEMGRKWLSEFMDTVITLSLYEQDEDDDINAVWKGRLSTVKPTLSEIKLVFESIFTSLKRPGLRARYQRTCRHMLYGRGCTLNKNDWEVQGFVTSSTLTSAVIPEAANYQDGWFTSGIIKVPDGSLRFITHHEGSLITLLSPSTSLASIPPASGAQVSLYPGCDRSRRTCAAKFSNLNNYGGFDWIPLKNPFDGSSIV